MYKKSKVIDKLFGFNVNSRRTNKIPLCTIDFLWDFTERTSLLHKLLTTWIPSNLIDNESNFYFTFETIKFYFSK